MMFFGKNKAANLPADGAQPKRRSVLGMMFNPDIGASLRPLGETTSIFVQLIAMIFAMNGLFPKDHPALKGVAGAKLTLSEILNTAWSGLSFTKAGLPKIALFFAVAGTLAFSVLAVITIFLLMFVGHAHAATSFFTPPDPTNDLAQGWMNFLFKATPLPNYVAQNSASISQYTGVQQALITALSFYSGAILIFAGVILFYHLVSMVVETAHTGVPMGKRANQIWAPIRLVVAIGLLVPVAASGLNCGQYIAIQFAEWGSGLASNVWDKFVTSFAGVSYVSPPAGDVEHLAETIVQIAACTQIYNYNVQTAAFQSPGGSLASDIINQQNIDLSQLSTNDKTGSFFAPATSREHVCGGFIIPNPPPMPAGSLGANVASAVQTVQEQALLDAIQEANTQVNSALFSSPSCSPTAPCFMNPSLQPAFKDIIGDVASKYQTEVSQGVGRAVQNLISVANQGPPGQFSWSELGWVSAGAYLNNIAHTQAEIEAAVRGSLPKMEPPTLGFEYGNADDQITAGLDYAAFMTWANTATDRAPYGGSVAGNAAVAQSCAGQGIFSDLKSFLNNSLKGLKDGDGLVDILFRIADYTAAMNCVWTPQVNAGSTFSLGVQLNSGDPFAAMVRLGHANLNTSYDLLQDIIGGELIGKGALAGVSLIPAITGWASGAGSQNRWINGMRAGTNATTALGNGAIDIIVSLVSFMGLIFFAGGFTLAYFLPLIPFLRFFFNILTWVVMVLESVIMMPLVALAHLNPEGDGLPGANAKNGYFFLFGIMLRPVLMVFGLICGLLIFLTAVAFMNQLYSIAVIGILGVGQSGSVFISRVIFSIFYVVLLYIAANNSFKLIHAFPDHAMAWIGGPSVPSESIGEAQEFTSLGPAISSYAGSSMFSAAKQGANALGQGVLGAVNGGVQPLSGRGGGGRGTNVPPSSQLPPPGGGSGGANPLSGSGQSGAPPLDPTKGPGRVKLNPGTQRPRK